MGGSIESKIPCSSAVNTCTPRAPAATREQCPPKVAILVAGGSPHGSPRAHQRRAVRSLVLLGPASAPAAERPGSILASYSFDDDVPTGPDTFRIFQYSKGTVRLTSAYHVSGYRAIRLRDVAGDKSMPEIQGYFPVQSMGRLHAHFSFLTATPKEELNVALAGPRFFELEKDGIGFWLKSEHGALVHYTGGVARRLFALQAFVWYSVDVVYDVAPVPTT